MKHLSDKDVLIQNFNTLPGCLQVTAELPVETALRPIVLPGNSDSRI